MTTLLEIDRDDRCLLWDALDYYTRAPGQTAQVKLHARQLRADVKSAQHNSGVVAVVGDDVSLADIEFFSSTGVQIPVAIVRRSNQSERTVVHTATDYSYVSRVMKNIQTDNVLGSLVQAIREATDQLESGVGGDEHTEEVLEQIQALMSALQDAKAKLESISGEGSEVEESDGESDGNRTGLRGRRTKEDPPRRK